MKTLHLLRHAKSDWSDPSIEDFARPLNRRGKRARRLIARYVAGWHIDLLVCSPAARARATAKPLIGVLDCPIHYDHTMYAADADDLLTITQQLPEETSSVMFVGHNPSLEEYTAMIGSVSPRYPTGALGTLELNVEHWSETTARCASLRALVTPSQLTAQQNHPPAIRWRSEPLGN
jgi:phosphohistidine phosphatase